MAVVDVNGVELQSGDNIVVIKDLKLKGSKNSVKQGTKAKIRLTKNENEVECKLDKLGTVILKTSSTYFCSSLPILGGLKNTLAINCP